MSNLSESQPDLSGFRKSEWVPDYEPDSSRSSTGDLSTQPADFPQFGPYSDTQAQTARIASRLIASNVTEKEYQELLEERQQLLDKQFAETITRRETIRLTYVRWSLGRIEDARHGQDLDRLEDHIAQYEHFLHDLDDLKAALFRAAKRRK